MSPQKYRTEALVLVTAELSWSSLWTASPLFLWGSQQLPELSVSDAQLLLIFAGKHDG